MSKPKRYRRLGGKRTPGLTYAVQTHEVDGPVPITTRRQVITGTGSELELRYSVRPASDRALGVIGIALAVAAVVGLVLAVALI